MFMNEIYKLHIKYKIYILSIQNTPNDCSSRGKEKDTVNRDFSETRKSLRWLKTR